MEELIVYEQRNKLFFSNSLCSLFVCGCMGRETNSFLVILAIYAVHLWLNCKHLVNMKCACFYKEGFINDR